MEYPEILYEDNHLLIAVKPSGMPSQGDSSGDPDMLTVLKAYIKDKYSKPGEVYLGLVHRLDRPSAGVMAFARTSKAASRLSEQLRTREMSRTYRMVVKGDMPDSGEMTDMLLKDEASNIVTVVPNGTPLAKPAKLTYKTLSRREGLSLVEAKLETGRSHQIRVQFSSRGFPLYGDMKYDPKGMKGGLALFAYSLKLIHPTKKEEMTFVADMPKDYPWSLFE